MYALSYEPLFPTYTTITTYSLYFFTLLFSILLAMQIFKPQLFCSHATSHKTDRIHTDCCLLCLAFVFAHDFSLMKILELESLGFRFLDNSFATSLLFVWCLLRKHTCLSLSLPCLLLLVYLERI